MIQELLARKEDEAAEKPMWHEDLASALQKIQPCVNDETSALQRSRLMRAVKTNPRDVHMWREFLTYAKEQRARAVSTDPNEMSILRNAVIFMYTTATTVIQMSSTNRFSLAYLSIWIDLAMLQDESPEDEYLAREIFKQLKYNRIGITFPDFWNAYADFEERHGDAEKAAKLRAKGATCTTRSISTDALTSSLSRQPRPRYGLNSTPQMNKENEQMSDIKPASHPRTRPSSKTGIPSRALRTAVPKDASPEANRGGLVADAPEQPELFSPAISSPLLRTVTSSSGNRPPRNAYGNSQGYLHAQLRPANSPNLPSTHSHANRASPSPMLFASGRSGGHIEMIRNGQNSQGEDHHIPSRQLSGYSSNNGDGRMATPYDNQARSRADLARPIPSREDMVSSCGKTPSPEHKYGESRPQKRMASNIRDRARLDIERREAAQSSRQNDYNGNPSAIAGTSPGTSGSRRTDSQGDMESIRGRRYYEDGSAYSSNVPAFLREIRCEEIATVNGTQYLVLGMIGKGGSSRVFRVLSPSRMILALKRVQVRRVCPNFKSTFDSYANEIDLLQRLRGAPNIVYCHDAEVREESGIIHLLMEYGDIDLAKRLTEGGKKSPKTIDENFRRLYWQQMLEAVQTIHEAKIVHGDLKPANFLIVAGTLKLIDFGIAKAIPSEDTTKIFRDAQVGTPNYMSPEALISYDGDDESSGEMRDVSNHGRGGAGPKYRIGRASDIWSLGCILYQMEYGKTPFAHLTNIMKKLSCIQDENYEIHYPAVEDGTILPVLKGCLQRDPCKRMSIPELLSHPFVRRCDESSKAVWYEGAEKRSALRHALEVLAGRGWELRKWDENCVGPFELDVATDLLMDELSRPVGDTPLRSGARVGGNSGKFNKQGGLTPTTSGVTNGTRTGGHSFSYGSASMMRGGGLRSAERQRQ